MRYYDPEKVRYAMELELENTSDLEKAFAIAKKHDRPEQFLARTEMHFYRGNLTRNDFISILDDICADLKKPAPVDFCNWGSEGGGTC